MLLFCWVFCAACILWLSCSKWAGRRYRGDPARIIATCIQVDLVRFICRPPPRLAGPPCPHIGNLMPRQCHIISYPCHLPPRALIPPRPLRNRALHNKLTAWPARVLLIKAHLYLVVHKTLSENEPTWPGPVSCPSANVCVGRLREAVRGCVCLRNYICSPCRPLAANSFQFIFKRQCETITMVPGLLIYIASLQGFGLQSCNQRRFTHRPRMDF